MNGRAYCLGIHAKSLRAAGESNSRIDQSGGWQVSDQYTEKERAALAWDRCRDQHHHLRHTR
ncbi:carboxymuconolactone decarboxylase family protein [Methylophilus methylotrophus]|uniref:carboxymuconolactone decarboxylase family protein n=1 Tax=Methylophilus methylotrophus TaxID=17 RepID=UPI0009D950E6